MRCFMPKKQIGVFITMLTVGAVMILAVEALAVPPAEMQGVIQDLQSQIDGLQTQLDSSQAVGTRVSGVDGSAQTVTATDMSIANAEPFITLLVTTTTDGTFVIGFSSKTDAIFCTLGLGGPCADVEIGQQIFLDGQLITEVRSPRIFYEDAETAANITFTAVANDVTAGTHTVEVRVGCRVPFSSTDCVSEGYKAQAIFKSFWTVHPK